MTCQRRHIRKVRKTGTVFSAGQECDVAYVDELTGAHHGQTDHELMIKAGKKIRGYIQYSLFNDGLYIKMIQVLRPYWRKGWATAMVKYLRQQYPNKTIHWGYATDSGSKFIKSLR